LGGRGPSFLALKRIPHFTPKIENLQGEITTVWRDFCGTKKNSGSWFDLFFYVCNDSANAVEDFGILFFAIFRNLQKKVPICKKKYAKILNSVRAVVTDVEKKVKPRTRIFFGSAKVAPDCSNFPL
jgi:hypothetical protein